MVWPLWWRSIVPLHEHWNSSFFYFNLDRVIKRPTGRKGYTKCSKIPTLFTDTWYEKLNIFRQKLNLKSPIYWQIFSSNKKRHLFLLTKGIFFTFRDCLASSAPLYAFLQEKASWLVTMILFRDPWQPIWKKKAKKTNTRKIGSQF